MNEALNSSRQIAQLNDCFRQTFLGGRIQMSAGIGALSEYHQSAILAQVQAFNNFTPDNDPYEEHDFGCFNYQNQRIFWKIDYYNRSLTEGSDHPADPQKTSRVLTIMLAEEY